MVDHRRFPLDVSTPHGRRNTVIVMLAICGALFVGLVIAIGLSVRQGNRARAASERATRAVEEATAAIEQAHSITDRFEKSCAAGNRSRSATNDGRRVARDFQIEAGALLLTTPNRSMGRKWIRDAESVMLLTTINCRTGEATEHVAGGGSR